MRKYPNLNICILGK